MRMHIVLDDDLVRQIDERAGKGGRTRYVTEALRQRLDNERRWESLLSAAGTVADEGHEWDDDPAAWVAGQRRSDPDRVG
ncbi:ribbon-helix-helix domain-containing protein [Geodermatophilus sp. YIM 151500]|uniref:ribbon-helix-helix domain-containing protein n=1 Tax=Geodermatophilus sp. YIM 151500 TaxID=2984531 RepID=UPI0021E3F9EC|nr:ribbon-helix-helix domain-containing protein [Geodermatophilus sp. YIM 151500]MCV2489029.1 ribbon-helix-helix domain-containing protein [Geodermatophilus sp. YIM 151500]